MLSDIIYLLISPFETRKSQIEEEGIMEKNIERKKERSRTGEAEREKDKT
jgi:hypothetical protein